MGLCGLCFSRGSQTPVTPAGSLLDAAWGGRPDTRLLGTWPLPGVAASEFPACFCLTQIGPQTISLWETDL